MRRGATGCTSVTGSCAREGVGACAGPRRGAPSPGHLPPLDPWEGSREVWRAWAWRRRRRARTATTATAAATTATPPTTPPMMGAGDGAWGEDPAGPCRSAPSLEEAAGGAPDPDRDGLGVAGAGAGAVEAWVGVGEPVGGVEGEGVLDALSEAPLDLVGLGLGLAVAVEVEVEEVLLVVVVVAEGTVWPPTVLASSPSG